MTRQPDWNALADLQFLLYNRIAGALNEALSSIALSDMPEAQDKPPGYWKERATNKIANVLNLFNAWSYLIRFKRGETIPERAIRPFRANALLRWLGIQLQLNPIPQLQSNPLLHANQETLQEALLLLYSVAYTQGAGVHVEVESNRLGAWFRVRFNRNRPLPKTLDDLLASFGDHWRAQDAAFELTTARDFVRLNGSELKLVASEIQGEFVFFVRAAGTQKEESTPVQAARSAAPQETPGQTRPLAPEMAASEHAAPTQVRGKTRPLAPAAEVGADKPLSKTTPEKHELLPDDATPVFSAAPIGAPSLFSPPREPEAPPLEVLRPLPPTLSELQRRMAERERDQSGAETRTPRSPDAAPQSDQPVIVPVKLPRPKLPEHLSKPPAATSNVALTKETQTLTPVKPPPDADSVDSRAAGEQRSPTPPESPDSAAPAPPSTHKDHS